MGDWIAFWNSDHSIYVNARHRDAHYRRIADDLMRYVPPTPSIVVDYGCGEALHADRVAAAAKQLVLVEAAPNVRARLAACFKANPAIAVRAPEEIDELDGRVDLVVLNSVAQYLTADVLDSLLARFRRLIKPGGLLVVGDVVPPDTAAAADVMALLRFAAANGFLCAALAGVARTVLSDYRQLRKTLSRYGEGAMAAKLAAAGFAASRAPANIGYNPTRMTFLARPV
jgi:SAM-dependent methyltransferase